MSNWCTARALGFPDSPEGLPTSVVDGVIEGTRVIHERADSTHVPSMLLDAQKGYPIEVEVIIGEVVRMAKAHNVAVPVCFVEASSFVLLLTFISPAD